MTKMYYTHVSTSWRTKKKGKEKLDKSFKKILLAGETRVKACLVKAVPL